MYFNIGESRAKFRIAAVWCLRICAPQAHPLGQVALDAVREEIGDTAKFFILTTTSLVNKTPIIDEMQAGLSTRCSGFFYDISEHAR